MKRQLKAAPSHPQQTNRHGNSLDALGDLLTTEEAAAKLRYEGPRAVANFFKWANRKRVPRLHRGSRVLWQASVLAAFLRDDKWTRNRHARTLRAVEPNRTRNTVARKSDDIKPVDGGV